MNEPIYYQGQPVTHANDVLLDRIHGNEYAYVLTHVSRHIDTAILRAAVEAAEALRVTEHDLDVPEDPALATEPECCS